MALRGERQSDKTEALRAMADSIGVSMRVACVGIVQSFDPVAITAVIQPVGQEASRNPDGSDVVEDLPLLEDVPVVFPQAGPFIFTMPVQAGDEALVVFADRCIDGWYETGDISPQAEARMHDLSDAIAYVGLRSKVRAPQVVGGVNQNNVQLRHVDGDAYVEITPTKDINFITPGNMRIKAQGEVWIDGAAGVFSNSNWDVY